MKSITQRNLACLTGRKSLSETDPAQLQARQLITVGGASRLVGRAGSSSPAGSRENEMQISRRHIWAPGAAFVRFLAIKSRYTFQNKTPQNFSVVTEGRRRGNKYSGSGAQTAERGFVVQLQSFQRDFLQTFLTADGKQEVSAVLRSSSNLI